MSAICRDCLHRWNEDAAPACPRCGGRRIAAHPELEQLGIAHLDCDAFFASIEKRDNPELRDKPVLVGGRTRGVVAAACYVARLYGARSAMPMFQALKLCPNAVVVKPDHAKYVAEGRRIRDMMREITPLVEPLSIDEAFLDLSGTARLHGGPPALTMIRLQQRIAHDVGVTVSVGLSWNKFLAKSASDLDKPDGFSVIGQTETADFLAGKPVGFVHGVGPAFERKLARDGLRVLADVRRIGEADMARRYGEAGLRLARLAWGADGRRVNPDEARKSISAETTFAEDISAPDELENRLWALCVRVADRAKAEDAAGRVVTLKLKTADHRIRTRRRALSAPTQLADMLFRVGRELLAAEARGKRFRLIGIGLSELAPPQGDAADLLDPGAGRRAALERAGDAARARYGGQAVMKGRALRTDPKKPEKSN